MVNQYEVMKTKMKKKNKNLRSNFRILNAQKNSPSYFNHINTKHLRILKAQKQITQKYIFK